MEREEDEESDSGEESELDERVGEACRWRFEGLGRSISSSPLLSELIELEAGLAARGRLVDSSFLFLPFSDSATITFASHPQNANSSSLPASTVNLARLPAFHNFPSILIPFCPVTLTSIVTFPTACAFLSLTILAEQ